MKNQQRQEYGCIEYGSEPIHYRVIYQQRKHLEITVNPDLSVIVKAPRDASSVAVTKRVTQRVRWIYQQREWFKQFASKAPQKGYIGGETHYYLGRQYRLKINESCEIDKVRLTQGYFLVDCKTSSPEKAHDHKSKTVKKLMDDWLGKQAKRWFHQLLDECWQKYHWRGLSKPRVQVRKMSGRWGSLSEKGTMTLNAQLIEAPRECIEYVITHELCHLIQKNHSPLFYEQLEQLMPDWQKRKLKLEMLYQ